MLIREREREEKEEGRTEGGEMAVKVKGRERHIHRVAEGNRALSMLHVASSPINVKLAAHGFYGNPLS